jgi:hypothetical protein
MRQQLAVAVLLLSVAFAPLSAQSIVRTGQWAEVQPGARVRIQSPGIVAGKYVATVLARTTDTITVGSPSSAPIAIPIAQITSIEISRGKSRTRGAVRGIQWGAPIGLGLGVLSMSAFQSCDGCDQVYSEGGWVALSTLSGVFYGSIIGALVGREHWESYSVPQRAALGVTRGGASLAMRFTF